jgi:tetratricopeptide (TPR) repeat protein
VTYKNMGELEQAEEAFRRALAADPLHYYAAFNLGGMRLLAGRVDQAREAMEIARERARAAGASTTAIDAVLADIDSRTSRK